MTTWRERWENSDACKRVAAVESFAHVHGFKEFRGETILEFIDQELTAQREAILALGEGIKAANASAPPEDEEEAVHDRAFNTALDAYQRAIKDMEA